MVEDGISQISGGPETIEGGGGMPVNTSGWIFERGLNIWCQSNPVTFVRAILRDRVCVGKADIRGVLLPSRRFQFNRINEFALWTPGVYQNRRPPSSASGRIRQGYPRSTIRYIEWHVSLYKRIHWFEFYPRTGRLIMRLDLKAAGARVHANAPRPQE